MSRQYVTDQEQCVLAVDLDFNKKKKKKKCIFHMFLINYKK